MATKPKDDATDPAAPENTTGADKFGDQATKQAAAKPGAQYRVTSNGISTPSGSVWQGETVTAAQLGDDARVQQLLERGSIEAI